jgi:hypothetical protein
MTNREFLNDLENLVNSAIDIPLHETKVQRLFFIMDEIAINIEDYMSVNNGILQSILFESPERTRFLVKQLSKAIETKCNNDIDLESIVVTHDWGWSGPSNESGSVISRYKDVRFRPTNEALFKKMWLKIFLRDLTKMQSAIHQVLGIEEEELVDSLGYYPFKSNLVKEQFLEYYQVYVSVDNWFPDVSFIKKKMEQKQLIHDIKDNEFINLLHNQFNLLNDIQYMYYCDKGKLTSLNKSETLKREDNFRTIFKI